MNFATALIEMCYRGHKIKRPHWKGYWKYHAGRDQVIIHTKEGNEFPITETSDIVYTLMSCSADDWQVVIDDDKSKNDKDNAHPVKTNREKLKEVFGVEVTEPTYIYGELGHECATREYIFSNETTKTIDLYSSSFEDISFNEWLNEEYKEPKKND